MTSAISPLSRPTAYVSRPAPANPRVPGDGADDGAKDGVGGGGVTLLGAADVVAGGALEDTTVAGGVAQPASNAASSTIRRITARRYSVPSSCESAIQARNSYGMASSQ